MIQMQSTYGGFSKATPIVYSTTIAVLSTLIDKLGSLMLVLAILLSLMVVDYISAVYAGIHKRRAGIKSHKTQWTLSKYVIYLFAITGSIFLGILLHCLFCLLNQTPLTDPSYILQFSMHLTVAIMILIIWNETVSVTENILLVHPDNKVFIILHGFLAFELVKKIPIFNMSKYYKVNKDGNKNPVGAIDPPDLNNDPQ